MIESIHCVVGINGKLYRQFMEKSMVVDLDNRALHPSIQIKYSLKLDAATHYVVFMRDMTERHEYDQRHFTKANQFVSQVIKHHLSQYTIYAKIFIIRYSDAGHKCPVSILPNDVLIKQLSDCCSGGLKTWIEG
jgi:hypothetical protein